MISKAIIVKAAVGPSVTDLHQLLAQFVQEKSTTSQLLVDTLGTLVDIQEGISKLDDEACIIKARMAVLAPVLACMTDLAAWATTSELDLNQPLADLIASQVQNPPDNIDTDAEINSILVAAIEDQEAVVDTAVPTGSAPRAARPSSYQQKFVHDKTAASDGIKTTKTARKSLPDASVPLSAAKQAPFGAPLPSKSLLKKPDVSKAQNGANFLSRRTPPLPMSISPIHSSATHTREATSPTLDHISQMLEEEGLLLAMQSTAAAAETTQGRETIGENPHISPAKISETHKYSPHSSPALSVASPSEATIKMTQAALQQDEQARAVLADMKKTLFTPVSPPDAKAAIRPLLAPPQSSETMSAGSMTAAAVTHEYAERLVPRTTDESTSSTKAISAVRADALEENSSIQRANELQMLLASVFAEPEQPLPPTEGSRAQHQSTEPVVPVNNHSAASRAQESPLAHSQPVVPSSAQADAGQAANSAAATLASGPTPRGRSRGKAGQRPESGNIPSPPPGMQARRSTAPAPLPAVVQGAEVSAVGPTASGGSAIEATPTPSTTDVSLMFARKVQDLTASLGELFGADAPVTATSQHRDMVPAASSAFTAPKQSDMSRLLQPLPSEEPALHHFIGSPHMSTPPTGHYVSDLPPKSPKSVTFSASESHAMSEKEHMLGPPALPYMPLTVDRTSSVVKPMSLLEPESEYYITSLKQKRQSPGAPGAPTASFSDAKDGRRHSVGSLASAPPAFFSDTAAALLAAAGFHPSSPHRATPHVSPSNAPANAPLNAKPHLEEQTHTTVAALFTPSDPLPSPPTSPFLTAMGKRILHDDEGESEGAIEQRRLMMLQQLDPFAKHGIGRETAVYGSKLAAEIAKPEGFGSRQKRRSLDQLYATAAPLTRSPTEAVADSAAGPLAGTHTSGGKSTSSKQRTPDRAASGNYVYREMHQAWLTEKLATDPRQHHRR